MSHEDPVRPANPALRLWGRVEEKVKSGVIKQGDEVFISYAHTSQSVFTTVQTLLAPRKVTVCDPSNFGEFNSAQMQACVSEARIVLAVLSEDLFKSKHCWDELSTAMQMEIPILPIFDESEYKLNKNENKNAERSQNVIAWKDTENEDWHEGFKGEAGAALRAYIYKKTVCSVINHGGHTQMLDKFLKLLVQIIPAFKRRLETASTSPSPGSGMDETPTKSPAAGAAHASPHRDRSGSAPGMPTVREETSTEGAEAAAFEREDYNPQPTPDPPSPSKSHARTMDSFPQHPGHHDPRVHTEMSMDDGLQQRPQSTPSISPQEAAAMDFPKQEAAQSQSRKRKARDDAKRLVPVLTDTWVKVETDQDSVAAAKREQKVEGPGPSQGALSHFSPPRAPADSPELEIEASILDGKEGPSPTARELAQWLDDQFAENLESARIRAEQDCVPQQVLDALEDITISTVLVSPITQITAKGVPRGDGGPFTVHLKHSCAEDTPVFVLTRHDSPLGGWDVVHPALYTSKPHWIVIDNVPHLSRWTTFTTAISIAARTVDAFVRDVVSSEALMGVVKNCLGTAGAPVVAAVVFASHLAHNLGEHFKTAHTSAFRLYCLLFPAGVTVTFFLFRHVLANGVTQIRVVSTARGSDPRPDPRVSPDRPPRFREKYVGVLKVTHHQFTIHNITVNFPTIPQTVKTFKVVGTVQEDHCVTPSDHLIPDALQPPDGNGQHKVRTSNIDRDGNRENDVHVIDIV